MAQNIIGILADTAQPQRGVALLRGALARAAGRFRLAGALHDLTGGEAALQAAAAAIRKADALLLVLPLPKPGEPSLLKALFDLVGPAALAGKPVLVLASSGGERRAQAILRAHGALFDFYELEVLAAPLSAEARDFTAGLSGSPVLSNRLDRVVGQFSAVFASRPRPAAPGWAASAGYSCP